MLLLFLDMPQLSTPQPPGPHPGPPPTPSQKPQYIFAVVFLSIIAAALSAGIIYLRPLFDPLLVIVAVYGAAAPTTGAILTFITARETHLAVNSRLDSFVVAARAAAMAEGITAGVEKEQIRTGTDTPPMVIATAPAPAVVVTTTTIPTAAPVRKPRKDPSL